MEKINLEMAEAEFDRFIDVMDIDISPGSMDDEDKANFDKYKFRFIKAVRNGSLVLNDNGEPTFTPQRSGDIEPIFFPEPDGGALMATDIGKDADKVKKTFAMVAHVTKRNPSTFRKMKLGDLNVCLAIVSLMVG